ATQVYVGIDVCKARLDVYLHPLGAKFAVSNDAHGFRRLKRSLEGHEGALVVMRRPESSTAPPIAASLRRASLSLSSIRCARACSPRPPAPWPRPTASTLGCWPSAARARSQARPPLPAHSCKPCGTCCAAGTRPS